jgi:ADP-heptose:LPS heptosyltransferase
MENILIYRLGSLGDTVVALPCFHQIDRHFPHARKVLLTNIPVSAVAAPLGAILGQGFVDELIGYPVGARSLSRLWSLSRQLRALRATTLVYLSPARGRAAAMRDWAFFKLCGFRTIIGLPLTRDLQFTRVDPVTGELERECSRLARTLAALGPIDLSDLGVWDLRLTQQELAAGRHMVKEFETEFIAINMGGKWIRNDWGAVRWRRLLDVLSSSHSGYGLLFVGSAEDSDRARDVSAQWPNRVIDACGHLSPRECAAALAEASLFMGHDSGPLHLAAAAGVTCIGLYSELNKPKKWHPYGEQHRLIHSMEGIDAITVDVVADAVNSVLPPSRSILEPHRALEP